MQESWTVLFFISILIISVFVISNINGVNAQNQTIRVYFMKSNSIAHIYMRLSSPLLNQTIKTGISLYDPHFVQNGLLNLSDLTIVPNKPYFTLDHNSSVVDYTVTSKNNLRGIFGASIYECGLSPFDVGLNDSEINPAILVKFITAVYSCPVETPYSDHTDIVNMTGIISKEVNIDFTKLGPMIQQQKLYIAPLEVKCKQGLELLIKNKDNSSVCVKPQTAQKLVERGWGTIVNLMDPKIISQTPIDENLARTLAESSIMVKAILMSGGYHYDGIFFSGNGNETLVNVVYQSNNGTAGPLVVTEDRHSTRIISVEVQPYRHYG